MGVVVSDQIIVWVLQFWSIYNGKFGYFYKYNFDMIVKYTIDLILGMK